VSAKNSCESLWASSRGVARRESSAQPAVGRGTGSGVCRQEGFRGAIYIVTSIVASGPVLNSRPRQSRVVRDTHSMRPVTGQPDAPGIGGCRVRFLLPAVGRVAVRAPFWGASAVLGTVLTALLATALTQIALSAAAFLLCGEFVDFEAVFYHSAVNFTTLGYGDIVISRHWRLLGPLEAVNGSLMLGLSAALLFAALARLGEAHPPRNDG